MSETIEGRNPVLELLKSGRAVSRIQLLAGQKTDPIMEEIFKAAKERGVTVELTDRHLLDKKSATGKHQGVIAYILPQEYCEIEDILEEAAKKGEQPLIVVLDGIEDPQNLGAIIRTAECTGVHGVVIPKRRAAPVTASVASASSGAIEYMKIARVTNISVAIEKLKDKGVWVVALEAGEGKAYDKVDLSMPTAIVIGSEGEGISKHVKEHCEIFASIPMKGRISSLNASVAAAVMLYEAIRQRAKDLPSA